MKPIIVYYPVGTVHMRNLDLLAQALPDFQFRVFYPRQTWFAPDKVKKYPYEHAFDRDGKIPADLFDGDVRALILTIAAVDGLIANLITAAFERDIPVIAIEEVIQLALNQGVINHYLMPVDHLLVASEYERDALVRLGVTPEKVQATGWPFYSKLITHASPEHRLTLQRRFKLPQGKMVAVLCLSSLKRSGGDCSLETPAVRHQLLSTVKQGLPDEFHLVIKLHPTEDVDSAHKTIEPYFSDATIIGGSTGIDEVLDVADVCLSRGNSQVVIEALLRGIPVLALPCGIPTLFDDFNDKVVIRSFEELEKALNHLYGGERFDYQSIMDTHFPWTPEQALQRTAKKIREIADNQISTRREQDWLDLALYHCFLGVREEGIKILDRMQAQAQTPTELIGSMLRLFHEQATLPDLELLLSRLNALYQRPLLLSLWIQQLHHSRRSITTQKLAIIERDYPFPPSTNPHNYLRYVIMLGDLYLSVKDMESVGQLYARLKEQYGFFDAVRDLSAKMDLAEGHINKNVMWYLCRRCRRCLTAPFRLALRVAATSTRKYEK
jgi:hypothetical protein